jgi:hypothetical protein
MPKTQRKNTNERYSEAQQHEVVEESKLMNAFKSTSSHIKDNPTL